MDLAIPVVLCFDANFVDYAAVATFSAFSNSKSKLKVYWVIPSEAESATVPIKELLEKQGVDISIQITSDQLFSDWKEQGHIKKAAYQRLLIPYAIPDPKIIYLDCDLIVQADLSELFKIEIGSSSVGGVHDTLAEKLSLMPKQDGDPYINSGVMILNLESLRKNQFIEKCTEIYHQFIKEVTFCDQCIINKYSEGQKASIDPSWNNCFFICHNLEMSLSEASTKFQGSKILHFVGPIKPWSVNCPPHLGDYWWECAHKLNLPNLERKPYNNLIGKKNIRKRIRESINKLFLEIKLMVKRLYNT
jgi:lipopolysaccharide biosynthesis glycosyltransferase